MGGCMSTHGHGQPRGRQRRQGATSLAMEEEMQPPTNQLNAIRLSGNIPKPYRYRPLKRKDAIRMVELLPGMPSEPIRVALHNRTLSDLPTCSAVSYEWGSNVRQHDIFCDGRVLKVTANLSLLLSKFRTSDSSQLFWIDAICINQDDLDERSQQILYMGKIFKNAAVVLMWVGDQAAHTKDAIPVIHRLAALLHDLKLKPGKSELEFFPYEKGQELHSSTKEWIEDIQKKEFWAGVADLVSSRTYFNRLWVIQEILLSSKAALICGDYRIDWRLFYEAVTVIRTLGISKGMVDFKILLNIAMLGELGFKDVVISMHTILEYFPHVAVTDPRDHVYGYLGILEGYSVDHKIHVDYSSTVEQVFQECTALMLTDVQSLMLYDTASVEPGSRIRATMPSWVRDFGVDQPQFYHYEVPEIAEIIGSEQTITVKGDYLTARGIIIDSIEQVSENFTEDNVEQILLEEFSSHLSILEKTQENVTMAARKTLLSIDTQVIRGQPLSEKHFCGLLSSWLFDDLGLTSEVIWENPTLETFSITDPSLQKWLPDEADKETNILDHILKNGVLQWATNQHHDSKDIEDCYISLSFRLFSKRPPLGVNMFRSIKGFRGVGPGGRNVSSDDLPVVQVGDHIVLFPTSEMPMILRDRDDGSYTLLGSAQVGNLLEIPWFEGETPELAALRIR